MQATKQSLFSGEYYGDFTVMSCEGSGGWVVIKTVNYTAYPA